MNVDFMSSGSIASSHERGTKEEDGRAKKSAIKEWREESEIESKVKLRTEIVFYGLPSH